MSLIHKTLAIIMLPLGALILLENFNSFSLDIVIDKLLLAAILMILLQISSLIHIKANQQEIKAINLITFVIFILPAALYLLHYFALFALSFLQESLPLILAILMLAEAVYALH